MGDIIKFPNSTDTVSVNIPDVFKGNLKCFAIVALDADDELHFFTHPDTPEAKKAFAEVISSGLNP